MKIIDRIKADYAKVKDQPPKEKLIFFWDYYKIPILCIILVVVLVVQGIASIVNHQETVFSAVLLNCKIGIKEDALLDGFYEYAGIDSKTQTAAFYSDMVLAEGNNQVNTNTIQRIMAGIAVQDTDFIAGTPYAFQMCAYHSGRILKDLRDFWDEDTLKRFSGRIYYVDNAIIDQINSPVGEQVEPSVLAYPKNPKDPTTMKDPIPVGIDISDRTTFQNAYYLPDTEVYMGVVANTLRPELTAKFIDYLFP